MKKSIFIPFCCLLALFFSISASAHAGDTDANGGHYDSDTGKYHYHHGYPAHMHYDIDGDGLRDCPYDFDDKTGVNSGSPGGSGTSSQYTPLTYSDGYADGHDDGYDDGYNDGYEKGKKYGYETGTKDGHTKGYTEGIEESKAVTPFWAWLVMIVLAICSVKLYLNTRSASSEIAQLRCDRRDLIHQQEDKIKKLTSNHHAALEEERTKSKSYAQTMLMELDETRQKLIDSQAVIKQHQRQISRDRFQFEFKEFGATGVELPEDIYFTDDFTPIKGVASLDYPFGDFTVFISRTGSCYHASRWCNGADYCEHAYEAVHSKKPCTRCKPPQFHIPMWYLKVSEIRKRKLLEQ